MPKGHAKTNGAPGYMGVNFLGTTRIYGTIDVELFEVSTAIGPVYMRHHGGEGQRKVLVVDAQKFLKLWRNTTCDAHKTVARGVPETWRNDYKFHWAAKGFSEGASNPVPLASINYEVSSRGLLSSLMDGGGMSRPLRVINFNDGITRTIWLLSNGADSFPIEVSSGSADSLRQLAGV